MKKKKVFLAILLGFALWCIAYGLGYAGPFVRCDQYSILSAQPDYFKVFVDLNPAVQSTPYTYSGETGVSLHYDLASVAVGTHTMKVQACIAADFWSPEVCSADSLPFTFTRRPPGTAPSVPMNLKLGIQ
jgi:hypothetical protein